MDCPCFSKKSYTNCCQKFHEASLPSTVIELMRSRYSAYALTKSNYIIETTHPKSPYFEKNRAHWKKGIEEFSRNTKFIDLKIEAFGENWVHFIAYLRQKGIDFELNEKSHFIKDEGKWLYYSGDFQENK